MYIWNLEIGKYPRKITLDRNFRPSEPQSSEYEGIPKAAGHEALFTCNI